MLIYSCRKGNEFRHGTKVPLGESLSAVQLNINKIKCQGSRIGVLQEQNSKTPLRGVDRSLRKFIPREAEMQVPQLYSRVSRQEGMLIIPSKRYTIQGSVRVRNASTPIKWARKSASVGIPTSSCMRKRWTSLPPRNQYATL